MWLFFLRGVSLRALISPIMRWRRGLMASVLMGTLRSEVDDTSSSGKGPRPAIIVVSNAHRARRKTARLRRLSRQRFSALGTCAAKDLRSARKQADCRDD